MNKKIKEYQWKALLILGPHTSETRELEGTLQSVSIDSAITTIKSRIAKGGDFLAIAFLYDAKTGQLITTSTLKKEKCAAYRQKEERRKPRVRKATSTFAPRITYACKVDGVVRQSISIKEFTIDPNGKLRASSCVLELPKEITPRHKFMTPEKTHNASNLIIQHLISKGMFPSRETLEKCTQKWINHNQLIDALNSQPQS